MGDFQDESRHVHSDGGSDIPFASWPELIASAIALEETLGILISQLLEDYAGGKGPPPASEDAIKSLETRKITKSASNAGKEECLICWEEVDADLEVTF